MDNINKILKDYTTGEADLEKVNAALKEAGAGFHLEPLTAEQRAEKSAREDAAAYIRQPQPTAPVQRKPDMRRRTDLAGQVVEQQTARGRYAVTYDELGYAVKAKRMPLNHTAESAGGGSDESRQ